jgi:hypothetical protein
MSSSIHDECTPGDILSSLFAHRHSLRNYASGPVLESRRNLATVEIRGAIMMLRGLHLHRAVRPWRHPSRLALFLALCASLAGVARPVAKDGARQRWRMIGHDARNTRNQPREHRIRPANVHRLAVKWVATTAGDVSATPAVVDGAVYFGDFGGMLWKLDARTGQVIWSRPVSDYTDIVGDIARTSPSMVGDTLVVGDLRGPNMLGIDAKTGELRWMPARRCSRRRPSIAAPVSSTARSDSRTPCRRASPHATPPMAASPNRASSPGRT